MTLKHHTWPSLLPSPLGTTHTQVTPPLALDPGLVSATPPHSNQQALEICHSRCLSFLFYQVNWNPSVRPSRVLRSRPQNKVRFLPLALRVSALLTPQMQVSKPRPQRTAWVCGHLPEPVGTAATEVLFLRPAEPWSLFPQLRACTQSTQTTQAELRHR